MPDRSKALTTISATLRGKALAVAALDDADMCSACFSHKPAERRAVINAAAIRDAAA